MGGGDDEYFFFGKIIHIFRDTPPRKKGWVIHFLKEFFNFDKIFSKFFWGDVRREQRKERTTERGNDWNDTTSALFKNLVNINTLKNIFYGVMQMK